MTSGIPTGIFATFVGGIETAQAFVTNFTGQPLGWVVAVELRDSGGAAPVEGINISLDPVVDPVPIDNAPTTVTFINVAPGVYSGWINYAPEVLDAPFVGWQQVTSAIYVTGPVPINPVGTHGRLLPTHEPAPTPTRG